MCVIVSLIDFKLNASLSSDQQEELILHHFLKHSLRTAKKKKFSLNVKQHAKLTSENGIYDLVFSDQYQKTIVGSGQDLIVYERSIDRENVDGIAFLFKVGFNIQNIHCLRLENENDEEFIYGTSSSHFVKIRMRDLMNMKGECVWKSAIMSNSWGFDLCGNIAHVFDFDQTKIQKYDRFTGLSITTDEEDLGIIEIYGVQFLSETKLMLTYKTFFEIFERQNSKWISTQKLNLNCNIYSMFYEKESNLVYLSNTVGHSIIIIKLDDLSIVKTFGEFSGNYGLAVDPKSGLLYICDEGVATVFIYA